MYFNELNLKPELLQAIEELGYYEPTEIQEQAIPAVLAGKDVLGQSHTGSGKTAAFGLPLLNLLTETDASNQTEALIILPTRELCLQVANELRKFATYSKEMSVVALYGGEPIDRQIRLLKRGKRIVVATPGRLLDHLRRRTIRVQNLQILVLDEADEMLNMGFYEDIEAVMAYLEAPTQTLLFSATMPKPIQELTKELLENPVIIKLSQDMLTTSTIEQIGYRVLPSNKNKLLVQLLEMHTPESCIIFSNTKKGADELATFLGAQGYRVGALHGDMKQEMRTAMMARFKEKTLSLLVATDVAARGIDVSQLDLVINYDVPSEIEYYVHRIGRTGRAGKEGKAITFVSPRQQKLLGQVEKLIKQPIKILPLPTQKQLSDLTLNLIEKEIKSGLTIDNNQQTLDIMAGLYERGYIDTEIIHGLLAKVVQNFTMKEIDENVAKVRKAQNYSRLVINLGRKNDLEVGELIKLIAKATSLTGKDIGKISLSQTSSTFEVPANLEKEVINALSNYTYNKKVLTVFKASSDKPRNRRPRNRRKTSRN